MRLILALHALLLVLASTDFTVVTAAFGHDSLRWCYFRFASQQGWGTEYVSPYTLPVVLTYLAAFGFGLVGFMLALFQRRRVTGLAGVVLSLLGLVSFGIEGSHWLFEHNRSWLAFSPAAMFVLVLVACLPRRTIATEQQDETLKTFV